MPQDIIKLIEARGEFITLEDGYVHYWPKSGGALAAAVLRVIADELDKRNAEWDKQVHALAAEPAPAASLPPQMVPSGEDYQLLLKLATRAVGELEDYPKIQALMDLTAAHLNGCKLDLEGLLHTNVINFVHDVHGIRIRLDRETGKLPADWTPRFCVERT